MEYKGTYYDYNLPMIDGAQLYVYMQNIEIIINYDETMPFNIEQIAVSFELGRDYIMYDVFKCFFFAKTIEEAKYKALIVAIQVYKSRRKNGMKNDYSDVLKIMDSVFPNKDRE